MLKNQWADAQFKIGSVNDRQPVDADDKLIVIAAPDPQGQAPGLCGNRIYKLIRAYRPLR